MTLQDFIYETDNSEYEKAYAKAKKESGAELDKFMNDAAQFTKAIGEGSAATLGFENPDDELINSLGTSTGKMFAGSYKALPELKTCQYCLEDCGDIAIRRLNTAYVEDRSNWMVSCEKCFNIRFGHYEERWRDYYAAVM